MNLVTLRAAALSLIGGVAPAAAPPRTVLVRGRGAPKYLASGPSGLYVADSGGGGPRCVSGVAGETETRVCAGATGSIPRIGRADHRVAARGLPSATIAFPHAVSGVTAVADAGANDIVFVNRRGRVRRIAQLTTTPETAPAGTLGPGFPAMTVQAQAELSSLAVGPHGALYARLLIGGPALAGSPVADRITPGRAPVPVVTRLTRVSDIAFDPRGRLDVLESSLTGDGVATTAQGALIQADLDASAPTTANGLDVPGLSDPVGLTINRVGTAYISVDTNAPGGAEVVAVHGFHAPSR